MAQRWKTLFNWENTAQPLAKSQEPTVTRASASWEIPRVACGWWLKGEITLLNLVEYRTATSQQLTANGDARQRVLENLI
jgi:hypothetical protein